MPTRPIARRLLFSFALALSILAVFEIVLRLVGFHRPPIDLPMVVWNSDEDKLMQGHTYLFQADDHSLWSPRPGATIQFAETERIAEEEQVNSAGYRGGLVAKQRTEGVLRVVTLGDSSTFGVGVPYASTYSARLAAEIEARGQRVEVIDAGVDGFTLRQGLERYRHYAREWRPDVVVAAFGAVNEHWPSSDGFSDDEKIVTRLERASSSHKIGRWLHSRLRLVQWLRLMIDPNWEKRLTLRGKELYAHARASAAGGSGEVAWKGKRRVSLEEFKVLLDTLAAEVSADGARLILIVNPRRKEAETVIPILPEYTKAVLACAAEQFVQILDARARFHKQLDKGATENDLFIGDYWHPNPRGHALIAGWLVDLVLDPTRQIAVDALPD